MYLPKTINTSRVFDSVGLAIVSDVAVLSNSLIVTHTLLPVHHAVLLGEGGPELASSCIESLLLQDLCQGRVSKVLWLASTQTGQNGNLQRMMMKNTDSFANAE